MAISGGLDRWDAFTVDNRVGIFRFPALCGQLTRKLTDAASGTDALCDLKALAAPIDMMPGMDFDNRFVETTPIAARPTDLPDGLFFDLAILAVQPLSEKYFAFPVGQIKITTRPVPPL